jgi:molybdate transport system substrate-binding protein
MRRLALICAATLVAAASLLAAGADAAKQKPLHLTVFAAASLTNVFPKIDKNGRYYFAGSNALAAQIEQGLPADVFASANTTIPEQLYEKGYVTKPVDFTANRLVIVVAHGNPLGIKGPGNLEEKGIKIVMAAKGVPVGDYTRTVLANLGMSNLVNRAVSQETDVREVLSKVVLGEADAGFVYATDAKTVAGQVSIVRIPPSAQPRVVYAAAAVKSSPYRRAAEAWVKRLTGARAQTKLRAAGFIPLPKPTG